MTTHGELDHTIVHCSDRSRSSRFLSDILGMPPPERYGPFAVVALDGRVSLDYLETAGLIAPQHYASLIREGEFDAVLDPIGQQGQYGADPGRQRSHQFNHYDGEAFNLPTLRPPSGGSDRAL